MVLYKKILRKQYDYKRKKFKFQVSISYKSRDWKNLPKSQRPPSVQEKFVISTPLGSDGRPGIIPSDILPSFFNGGSQNQSSWIIDKSKYDVNNMYLKKRTTKHKIIDKNTAGKILFESPDNLILKQELFKYDKQSRYKGGVVRYKSGIKGSSWVSNNLVNALNIGNGGLHSYDNPFFIEEEFIAVINQKNAKKNNILNIITSDITQCDMGGVPLNLYSSGSYESNASMILK